MIELNMNSYHWGRIWIHMIEKSNEWYEFICERWSMNSWHTNSYKRFHGARKEPKRLTLDSADTVAAEVEVVNAVGEIANASTSTKRGARNQWGEIQVTVCQSRVRHGLWGGCLYSHDRCMNSMAVIEVWGVMDRRYEVMCWVERKRDIASWWWWQMVFGDVALMWQQVHMHKQSFQENMEY